MGADARAPSHPLLIEEVPSDRRFDPGVDGRVGVEPITMAVAAVTHQGRLLGVIQLINRIDQAQYSRVDGNVLSYVAEKLGEFLYQTRMRPDEHRA
jgi:hypothetical protein